MRTINVKNSTMSIVALSPDGRILASCQVALTLVNREYDYSIHLWEMETGKEILQFQPGSSAVGTLAFSADGRTLISGMNNGTVLTWNMKSRPAESLSQRDLKRLWNDLAGDDAPRAYVAICSFAAIPAASVSFLKDRLLAPADINVARVRALIADLGNEKFPIRQTAQRELAKLRDDAAVYLRGALADNPPLEMRRRLESLLTAAGEVRPGLTLRRLRAIQALEDIGTKGALQVLQSLADVAAATGESEDARLSVDRVQKRLKAVP